MLQNSIPNPEQRRLLDESLIQDRLAGQSISRAPRILFATCNIDNPTKKERGRMAQIKSLLFNLSTTFSRCLAKFVSTASILAPVLVSP